MALHPDFPDSPYAILEPDIRWFPADEALRESSMEKLMPPLVSQLLSAARRGAYFQDYVEGGIGRLKELHFRQPQRAS